MVTGTVVTDRALAQRIRDGDDVSPQEVQQHSVQIWEQKFEKLHLDELLPKITNGDDEIYEWTLGYDPEFLGVMEGLLPLLLDEE